MTFHKRNDFDNISFEKPNVSENNADNTKECYTVYSKTTSKLERKKYASLILHVYS